jgi:cell division protease FtsH
MDAKVGQRTYAPRPQTFLAAIQDMVVRAAEATGREIDRAARELIEAGDVCTGDSRKAGAPISRPASNF